MSRHVLIPYEVCATCTGKTCEALNQLKLESVSVIHDIDRISVVVLFHLSTLYYLGFSFDHKYLHHFDT